MTRRRPAAGALAGLVAAGALVVAAPGPASAADPDGDSCLSVNQADAVPDTAPTVPSAPLVALDIAGAHQVVRQRVGAAAPGTGVRVAVIDSGVGNPDVPVYDGVRLEPYSVNPGAVFYHGTAVAGVIAGAPADPLGAVGIAPGAEIYDVRVYDAAVSDDDTKAPTELGIVAGLQAVAPLAGTGPGDIRIVNVSLSVERPSDALEAAVRAVTRTGAIVVASSGNRVPETTEASEDDDTSYEYGEDVTFYPAGYSATDPLVLSVGTTTDPTYEDLERPAGLLSSSIDVVVPTYGAVSYAVNGTRCRVYASSTSIAAAEVSGVLALLAATYPDETGEQLIARLETTATGGSAPAAGVVDKFRGRGVVQPVEALTRPLRPGRDGSVADGPPDPPRAQAAPLPEEEPDVLAGTRRDAVWWGLFGGGALVVALLLRPVLSRRRA